MIFSLVRFNQVVYAKTDMAAHSKGITAFIIEKGMPGYAPFAVTEVQSCTHFHMQHFLFSVVKRWRDYWTSQILLWSLKRKVVINYRKC